MNPGAPRRIAVLGAGLTGLSAAYELFRRASRGRQPSIEVAVFEAADRAGGKVRTESNDGVAFESGPESFSTAKPQVMELARELGLGNEIMPAVRLRRAVLILSGGRLRLLPEGMGRIVPGNWWSFLRCDLLSWKGKLRLLGEPFVPVPEGDGDESLAVFFGRRLGREAVANLVDPIAGGICLGDPARLSLNSIYPAFADAQRRGGLIRDALRRPRAAAQPDPAGSATLSRGLSLLPESLARRLPAGSLRLGAAVTKLARRNGSWEVRTAAGGELFDAVIAAVPAPALAAVVEGHDCELAGILREIPYASSAVVTVAYERAGFPHPLDACGLLVPRGEGRRLVAATFTSSKFPGRVPADLVLLRGLLGGAGREAQALGEDAQAGRTVRAEFRDILGLGDIHPRWTRVTRWPQGHPQYTIGHTLRLRRLDSCLRSHSGLMLAGESYQGFGLPECIRSGRLAAAKLLTPAGGRTASGVA